MIESIPLYQTTKSHSFLTQVLVALICMHTKRFSRSMTGQCTEKMLCASDNTALGIDHQGLCIGDNTEGCECAAALINVETLNCDIQHKQLLKWPICFGLCIGTLPSVILYPYTAEGNLEGRGVQNPRPRGMYFPMHPDSRQCTSILSTLAGKY